MKKLKILLTLTFLLFVITCIVKGNTGKPDVCLHGYVTDAITKKPISGVIISASAPGINCTAEVTTDADGYFSFGQLPAPQVNLQFGKKGYQNYKRNNVSVKEKAPLKLIVEFFPENKGEESDESEYPILRMLQFNK